MRNKRDKNSQWNVPGAANELFGRKAGSKFNSQLLVNGPQFDRYALGYRLVADTVVDSLRGSMGHVVVFPVCYLYRHYLELKIKHLTSLAKFVLNEEHTFLTGHELGDLWKECRPLLEKMMPDRSKAVFDTVGNCVDAFASFDFEGEYSRYPEDVQGRAWKQSVKDLSLQRMQDAISDVADLLDTFYYQMDNILECRALAIP
jgi:hypothetical protein